MSLKNQIPLFRVWLLEEKRMIYVASPKNDTSLLINECDWLLIDHYTGSPEVIAEGEKGDILMRGFELDRKVIYEFDIVNYIGKFRHLIKYRDGAFGFNVIPTRNTFVCIASHNYLSEIKKNIKVLGNKFEQPGLIK